MTFREIQDYLIEGSWAGKKVALEITHSAKTKIKRGLANASLAEIGEFFWEISRVNKEIATVILQFSKKELKTLSKIRNETLDDIITFLKGIQRVDTTIAPEIIKKVKNGFKNQDAIRDASFAKISTFFRKLRKTGDLNSDSLYYYEEALKNKEKLRKTSVSEIGEFIGEMAHIQEDFALEMINYFTLPLKESVQAAPLSEIGDLFEEVTWVSKSLSVKIAQLVKKEIRQKIRDANLSEIGLFFEQISDYEKVGLEIIQDVKFLLSNREKIRNSPLSMVGDFFRGVGTFQESLVLTIIHDMNDSLQQRFNTASLSDIGEFYRKIAHFSDSQIVYEFFSLTTPIIVQKISHAPFSHIGTLFLGVAQTSEKAVEDLLYSLTSSLEERMENAEETKVTEFYQTLSDVNKQVVETIHKILDE